jgi:hypothetical protein
MDTTTRMASDRRIAWLRIPPASDRRIFPDRDRSPIHSLARYTAALEPRHDAPTDAVGTHSCIGRMSDSICLSAMRRSRHCDASTPSSDSGPASRRSPAGDGCRPPGRRSNVLVASLHARRAWPLEKWRRSTAKPCFAMANVSPLMARWRKRSTPRRRSWQPNSWRSSRRARPRRKQRRPRRPPW